LWRIVHLTDVVDPAIVAAFGTMGRDVYLRVFNQVYLREDLGLDLRRKPTGA
jgi:hypothetical protein